MRDFFRARDRSQTYMPFAAGNTVPGGIVGLTPMDDRYTDVFVKGEFLFVHTSATVFCCVLLSMALLNHRHTLV